MDLTQLPPRLRPLLNLLEGTPGERSGSIIVAAAPRIGVDSATLDVAVTAARSVLAKYAASGRNVRVH